MVYFLGRKRGAVESSERTSAALYRRRPAPGVGSDRLPHDRHGVLRRAPGDECIGERGELSGQVHSRVCVRIERQRPGDGRDLRVSVRVHRAGWPNDDVQGSLRPGE